MSCTGISFQTPDGNWHCIDLYYPPIEWPPHGPDPEKIFHDLRVLAIINQGVARISDRRIRDTLGDAVRGAAKSIPLPKGIELGDGLFKPQMAMEPAE